MVLDRQQWIVFCVLLGLNALLSFIASATAGFGEEIVFRGFVMGVWAFLLNLLQRRLILSTFGRFAQRGL
jgi:hypothetical protein